MAVGGVPGSMLASTLGVLSDAGADVPAWAIVGGPLAAGVAAVLVHRARTRAALAAA